jgi:hypothetical protein
LSSRVIFPGDVSNNPVEIVSNRLQRKVETARAQILVFFVEGAQGCPHLLMALEANKFLWGTPGFTDDGSDFKALGFQDLCQGLRLGMEPCAKSDTEFPITHLFRKFADLLDSRFDRVQDVGVMSRSV